MDSKEVKDVWKIIRAKDSINLIKITTILDKYGWLGTDVVGNQGNSTLFLVIQHADLKTREMFLPHLKKAVKEKELPKNFLMLIVDRIYLDKYNTQIFGSQSFKDVNDKEFKSVPIDTSEEALKLKKEIDDM